MRWAIVSDIHANLQAWTAVYEDIRRQDVDRIIHLGDLVGYGPNPLEVCTLARAQIQVHLLGNHDAAICDRIGIENWNPRARQMIEWTRARLPASIGQWFGQLPYTFADLNVRCGHAEFSNPASFYYITKPAHADFSWRKVGEPLLFSGHSHRAALYVRGPSGVAHQVIPQPFECEPGKRYLVNVGSVGYPRDIRDQACYCLFDTESRSVFWRRVAFDYDGYLRALAELEDAPFSPAATAVPAPG